MSVDELDTRLNLTDDAVALSHSTHLPLGLPQLNTRDVSACVLTQTGYVSGYSHSHHMPLWSAFTIEKQVSTHLKIAVAVVCWSYQVTCP